MKLLSRLGMTEKNVVFHISWHSKVNSVASENAWPRKFDTATLHLKLTSASSSSVGTCCSHLLLSTSYISNIHWLWQRGGRWILTTKTPGGTFCTEDWWQGLSLTGSASQWPRLQRFPSESGQQPNLATPSLPILLSPVCSSCSWTSCSENSSSGTSLFAILLTEIPKHDDEKKLGGRG